jgi:hypothetical protein
MSGLRAPPWANTLVAAVLDAEPKYKTTSKPDIELPIRSRAVRRSGGLWPARASPIWAAARRGSVISMAETAAIYGDGQSGQGAWVG